MAGVFQDLCNGPTGDRWSIQVGTQRPSESKGLGRDFTGNLSQDNLVAQRKIGGRIHAVYSV